MEYNVVHNEGMHRFETQKDGGRALVEYQVLDKEVMNIYHTEVPKSMEGHGVGSAMMKEALSFARKNRYKVLPTCPFAQAYLSKHPGFQDILT